MLDGLHLKNDQEGNICLENWLEQCIDWCYQKVEKNRYGDQKLS